MPALGTKQFAAFAQRAYSRRFSETKAVRELWKQARFYGGDDPPNSRPGFNRVRDRFWTLVRDVENANGQIVKAILEEAGFDLSGSGAPTLKLSARSAPPATRTGLTASDIGARMLKETAIDRRGKNLTAKQRAVRQRTERALDVDHAYPAARATKEAAKAAEEAAKAGKAPVNPQPQMWLDAANLQFMFGDDNRWHKGDRYTK